MPYQGGGQSSPGWLNFISLSKLSVGSHQQEVFSGWRQGREVGLEKGTPSRVGTSRSSPKGRASRSRAWLA